MIISKPTGESKNETWKKCNLCYRLGNLLRGNAVLLGSDDGDFCACYHNVRDVRVYRPVLYCPSRCMDDETGYFSHLASQGVGQYG